MKDVGFFDGIEKFAASKKIIGFCIENGLEAVDIMMIFGLLIENHDYALMNYVSILRQYNEQHRTEES